MRNVLYVLVFAFFLTSCSQKARLEQLSGMTMGTTYTIKYLNKTGITPNEILSEVDTALEDVNQKMSTWRKRSELSLLNKSKQGVWTQLSDELYYVIDSALSISVMTDGAFDITVGPAVNLWGFGPDGKRKIPSKQQINNTLQRIGHSKILIDRKKRKLSKTAKGLYIDLSAIAKGHGVDRVASALEDLGIDNYMVEIGGEVRTKGEKNKDRPWRIGIEAPSAGRGNFSQVINISGMSVATSGNYRNYFESGGKMFSHTIDPKSARPVDHFLISASVVDEKCMMADAFATALMVMGPDKARKFVESNQLAAYFIYKDKEQEVKTYMSSKFKKLFL